MKEKYEYEIKRTCVLCIFTWLESLVFSLSSNWSGHTRNLLASYYKTPTIRQNG